MFLVKNMTQEKTLLDELNKRLSIKSFDKSFI